MARKDKPYLPLYVQDLLTDEKLIECSAEAHGVYFRLMCILHKQEKYGLLCLKQKHKQSESKYENFASILVRQMPFRAKQIQTALEELHIEGVIDVNETSLSQKRMINDGEISISRSITGKMGGSSVTKQYGKIGFLYWIGDYGLKNKIGISVNVTNRLYRLRSDFKLKKLMIIDTIEVEDMGVSEDIALDFFKEVRDGEWVNLSYDVMLEKFALLKASIKAKIKAKTQANSESEYEYVNNILNGHFEKNVDEKKQTMVVIEMMKIWMKHRPDYTGIVEADYPALLDISYIMAKSKGWQKSTVVGEHEQDILDGWEKICAFLSGTEADRFLRSLTIDGISIPKNFQKVVESMKVGKSAVIQKQKEAEKGRITHEQYFKE